ncbi:xylulokinase [Mangrovactinospora gilvigrisea]|uniref:Xylulose kinase n=1 Tax=Mangrovactinospora gilvigrisea TaxID=1428644 RepID=A0A1J7C8M9_9ACTN|nr:xylulokinase [Mangrovactinospora gilvigrisea]OIV35986.1 xylulokinase [Mangrovactinospora gilvigrisea]
MAAIVIGVDSSTQATKALAVDVESGEVVGTGRAPHTVRGTGGARESDPEQWWDALRAALEATGRAGEAAAVSVGGQQHGLVALGADGRPVRPALLWNDVRPAPQAERLVAALGGPQEWARRIGSVPTAAFTAAKWAWLRANEPEAAARVRGIRLPHDYLTGRLLGDALRHGVTDRGDASGTGWWSAVTGAYAEEVLALPEVALDPALLPEVALPGKPVGEAAAGLPLRPGALVATGTGDNMAAAAGLGLSAAGSGGTAVLSLGTSGTAYTASARPAADPTGVVAGFADTLGGHLPLACTLNCTLAVDKTAALLGLDRDAAADSSGEVVMLPFLDGERTPNLPYASGLLYGLRQGTTGAEVLRAAYEGAAYLLLAALDEVRAQAGGGGSPSGELLLIGGGARGRVWLDVVRRLSGAPVRVPRADELVALGAAAQAAGLLTGEDAAAVAHRWQTATGPVHPAVRRDERACARLAEAVARSGELTARPL